jgi:hypothetical protein
MRNDGRAGIERVAGAAYFVAFLLVVTPALDYLTNITPMLFGSVDWRYGVVGLLSGFLLTPLLGMALAALVAGYTASRRARVTVGTINLIFGLGLIMLTPLFALDFLQLRASIPAADLRMYEVGGIKALIKNASGAVAFVWLAVAGLRGARAVMHVPVTSEAPIALPVRERKVARR